MYKRRPFYCFYSEAEYREHFFDDPPPIIENWRDGEIGDFVRTDDGKIAEVITIYRSEKTGDLMITPIGPVNKTRKDHKLVGEIDYSKSIYSFNLKNRKTLIERIRNGKFTSNEADKFIMFLKMQMDPYDAFCLAYFRIPKKDAHKFIKELLKQEYFMKALKKEVSDALEQAKVSHVTIIKDLAKLAKDGESEKIKLDAIKELIKIAGTDEKIDDGVRRAPAGSPADVLSEHDEPAALPPHSEDNGLNFGKKEMPLPENGLPANTAHFLKISKDASDS